MDLTPIYELRSRLRATAIAGTELMGEDYRLKRALESMKPLENASPVFAKISVLVKKMLAPNCPDRVGFLMEAISLTDALLCTQGAMAVSGTLQEMKHTGTTMKVLNVPYSILHTLLDALQNSGQGRYGYVLRMREQQPELFMDYRVKKALVQALGASYVELADDVVGWLKEDGEDVIPLLLDGFDKKGKKEMIRRVQIVEHICKDAANNFYLEQIPDSEKNIRATLIWALRHSQENVQTLIDLTRTEKGNCKKMAYWALASIQNEEAEAFWRTYVKKKPLDAIPYLEVSKADWASELIVDAVTISLQEWMPKVAAGELETKEPWKDELTQRLCIYQNALLGKTGEDVCACLRQMVNVEKMLHLKVDSAYFLQTSYQLCPSTMLGALALEFYEKYGVEYFSSALMAKLVENTFKECCEWVEEQIWQKNLFDKKIKETYVVHLLEVLTHIFWDEQLQSYVLNFSTASPVDGQLVSYRNILHGFEKDYFVEILKKIGRLEADQIMVQWIGELNGAYCQMLMDYYYKRAWICKDNRPYVELLKRCGATDCKDFAVRYFSRKTSTGLWEIPYYFIDLFGSAQAKREEARRLCEAILKGSVRGVRIKEDEVDVLIDSWLRERY